MDQQSFQYGDSQIHYDICYKPLKKNRVRIHVHHNGKVRVDAPVAISLKEIRSAVLKKSRWIHKHVHAAKERFGQLPKREYVSGESHYYLGRQFLLKVHLLQSRLEKERVRLGRTTLEVFCHQKEPKHVRYLLQQWYGQRALIVMAKRMEVCVAGMLWLKDAPTWKVRDMKKQWGSCSPKGVISLNPKLIKASRECIDYVIIHELCHIKEHNHSKRYYDLLSRCLPAWRQTKIQLDEMAGTLIGK